MSSFGASKGASSVPESRTVPFASAPSASTDRASRLPRAESSRATGPPPARSLRIRAPSTAASRARSGCLPSKCRSNVGVFARSFTLPVTVASTPASPRLASTATPPRTAVVRADRRMGPSFPAAIGDSTRSTRNRPLGSSEAAVTIPSKEGAPSTSETTPSMRALAPARLPILASAHGEPAVRQRPVEAQILDLGLAINDASDPDVQIGVEVSRNGQRIIPALRRRLLPRCRDSVPCRDSGRDPGFGCVPGRNSGRNSGRSSGRDSGRDFGRDFGRDPGCRSSDGCGSGPSGLRRRQPGVEIEAVDVEACVEGRPATQRQGRAAVEPGVIELHPDVPEPDPRQVAAHVGDGGRLLQPTSRHAG